jgi:hypothetical protein
MLIESEMNIIVSALLSIGLAGFFLRKKFEKRMYILNFISIILLALALTIEIVGKVNAVFIYTSVGILAFYIGLVIKILIEEYQRDSIIIVQDNAKRTDQIKQRLQLNRAL